MNDNTLGNTIRQERLRKGLTQEQLAEKAEISLNFMSLIENGKNMSAQTLIKIAQALDIDLNSLVSHNPRNENDRILEQIIFQLSSLSDAEKLYFLSMITQYKSLGR